MDWFYCRNHLRMVGLVGDGCCTEGTIEAVCRLCRRGGEDVRVPTGEEYYNLRQRHARKPKAAGPGLTGLRQRQMVENDRALQVAPRIPIYLKVNHQNGTGNNVNTFFR